MVRVCASKVVPIDDFCKDLWWDRFVSIAYVSSGDEFCVCLDYGVCYAFCFLDECCLKVCVF